MLAALATLATLAVIMAVIRASQLGWFCENILSLECAESTWSQVADFLLFRWIYDWQTLVTGIAALLAAVITVAQVERSERDRLRRRHASARAILPLALSAIIEFAKSTAFSLEKVLIQTGDAISVPKHAQLPEFPTAPASAIEPLRDFIETLRDDKQVEFVSRLLANMQILMARIEGLKLYHVSDELTVTRKNLEYYVIDAARIYAHCIEILKYARFDTDDLPQTITRQHVLDSVELFAFDAAGLEGVAGSMHFRPELLAKNALRPLGDDAGD